MRPEILFPLFNDVTALPGIGPRLATLLAKLAGPKVKDVLFHKPTGLVDRSLKTSIRDAQDGAITTITARVDAHLPNEIQGKPYKVRLFDETGFLHLPQKNTARG
jgi:ATP-dependent DNA helicase RecG